MTFNAAEHISKVSGRDYLEVKWRIAWFRDAMPNGGIQTEIISTEPPLVRAIVTNEQGAIIATAHGSADDNGKNVVWKGRAVEKAETAAIGRALAHAGFGTQFVDDDESAVVDSPVERKPAPQQPAPAYAPPPVVADTITFVATRVDEGKSSKGNPFWKFFGDNGVNANTFQRPTDDVLSWGKWSVTAVQERVGDKMFYSVTDLQPVEAKEAF